MSDPLENMEIQDVLSSIRRLVSEDRRDPARDRRAGIVEAKPVASDDKLVLTAAQRIRGSEAPGDVVEAEAVASPGGMSPETTVAELEASVADTGAELAAAADENEDATAGGAPESGVSETAIPGEEPARGTATPAGFADTRRLNLTARDLVAGEAEGESLDTPEEAGQEPHPGAQDGITEAEMEILRDLVAEIIREELRGPLGERITGNVRMLVRREINRALASRNLD